MVYNDIGGSIRSRVEGIVVPLDLARSHEAENQTDEAER
jgi:hypothetical protein